MKPANLRVSCFEKSCCKILLDKKQSICYTTLYKYCSGEVMQFANQL